MGGGAEIGGGKKKKPTMQLKLIVMAGMKVVTKASILIGENMRGMIESFWRSRRKFILTCFHKVQYYLKRRSKEEEENGSSNEVEVVEVRKKKKKRKIVGKDKEEEV